MQVCARVYVHAVGEKQKGDNKYRPSSGKKEMFESAKNAVSNMQPIKY